MAPLLQKDILVESSLKFTKISNLRIEEKINEHATAYISGILHDQITLEEVYQLNHMSNFRIKATMNSKEKIIFLERLWI